jgi:hypothetical protein
MTLCSRWRIYRTGWNCDYAHSGAAFGWNAVVGYTTCLVVLAGTDSMAQLDLGRAVYALSGKLRTLDGTFALVDMGEQVGEVTPIGQARPEDRLSRQRGECAAGLPAVRLSGARSSVPDRRSRRCARSAPARNMYMVKPFAIWAVTPGGIASSIRLTMAPGNRSSRKQRSSCVEPRFLA